MTDLTMDLGMGDLTMDLDGGMNLDAGMDLDADMDVIETPVAAKKATKPAAKKAGIFSEKKATKTPVKAAVPAKAKRSIFTSAPAKKEERVIAQHQQYPREMLMNDAHVKFLEFFNQYEEFAGKPLPKAFTAQLFAITENLVASTVRNHPLRFAAMQFKHAAIKGRVNPNPQGGDEQTYTTGHIAIKVMEAATPRAVIKGIVSDEGFVPNDEPVVLKEGRDDEGKDILVDHDAYELIESGETYVTDFKAERSKRAPNNLKK